MLQINYIRQHPEEVKNGLLKRNFTNIALVDELLNTDEELRKHKADYESLQANINAASKEIGALMAKGEKDKAAKKKQQVNNWRDQQLTSKSSLQELEEKFTA